MLVTTFLNYQLLQGLTVVQVNEPFHPGPIAVIADCPDESYLPSLFGAAIWRERFFARSEVRGGSERKQVAVVCHLAAAEVNF